MKVTNNKIGPSAGKVDTARTGKADRADKADKAEGSRGLLDAKNSGAAATNANTENVNVSDRAQMMNKAKDIASQSTVDEAKVARLQKLIDEGKYKTDARDIADRLVDSHLEIPD